MSQREIREALNSVYTSLAEYSVAHNHEHAEGESCGEGCASCGGGCSGGCGEEGCGGGDDCGCGGFDPVEASLQMGYTVEELESVPALAVMGLGCGNPVASASLKEGERVLDLGSGGGLDALLASLKVGVSGKVTGVDSNESMVRRASEVAEANLFRNVEFRVADMEKLPLDAGSVDAVLSNCSINLTFDKPQVFREAYRVLKRGGRLVFSDMVRVKELPEDVKVDVDAWLNCIASTELRETYLKELKSIGFTDIKVITDDEFGSDREDMDGVIHAVTIHATKL